MTAAELAATMARRADRLEIEVRNAVRQAGSEALDASRQEMEAKIYSHPIPTTKSGKPRWVQTRNLLRHERVEPAADGLGANLVNDMPYARRRHDLGKPNSSPTPWPAHWRDEALGRIRETFSRRVAERIRSVWERS